MRPTTSRPRVRDLSLVLASLVLAGCRVGGLNTQETIARAPAGIRILMATEHGRLVGELLEIRTGGLLLLADTAASSVALSGRVTWVPLEVVPRELRAGTSYPSGDERGRVVRIHEAEGRRWLAGLARFPYGMSPAVERGLLEAHGQEEMARIPDASDHAHGPEPDVDAFLDDVARGVRAFEDRSEAVRYGYRRIGPDFPGMGEHWVNPGLVLSGGVNPSRPQILTYVEADGRVRLTGAAFALALGRGEEPPSAPLGADVWHDHGGSVDEEALILESPTSMHHDPDGPRLAMFHVWLWPENPEGALAQNNWTLAWVRLGLEPPEDPDPMVARALSLYTDEGAYYKMLLARVAGVSSEAEDSTSVRVIHDTVDRAAVRVAANLASRSDTAALSPEQAAHVKDAWGLLWEELERDLDGPTWSRLVEAHREWGGG